MLQYYIQQFDTVELNNTFYRLPTNKPRDVAGCHPAGFRFAVKGSRFLTHMKKLNDAQQGLDRFLDAINVLDPK